MDWYIWKRWQCWGLAEMAVEVCFVGIVVVEEQE